MAGRGPAPKAEGQKVTRHKPTRGEAKAVEGVGWRHGKVPAPPEGLMPATVEAWSTWMTAWFAAHWTTSDLPGLRQVIRLYDQVERGEFQRATELRLQMDTFGITPKGQQDRRWVKPDAGAPAEGGGGPKGSAYSHLRAV